MSVFPFHILHPLVEAWLSKIPKMQNTSLPREVFRIPRPCADLLRWFIHLLTIQHPQTPKHLCSSLAVGVDVCVKKLQLYVLVPPMPNRESDIAPSIQRLEMGVSEN